MRTAPTGRRGPPSPSLALPPKGPPLRRAALPLALALAASAPAATVFREHVVTDPGMGNHPALTVLVPEGWEVEGGMSRPNPQLFSMPTLLDLKVRAPDGRQARFYPAFQFEYSSQQPRPPMTPTMGGRFYYPLPPSPGAWLEGLMRAYPDPKISNGRVASEAPDPQGTAQLRQQFAGVMQMIQQGRSLEVPGGPQMFFDAQVTRIVLRYQESGRDLEETITMGWNAMNMVWNGQPFSGQWGIVAMVGLRGAPGTAYEDDPVLQAILRSTRSDPVWTQRMQEHWQEMARIQARGAAQRQQQSYQAHQKRMQTLSEINDIIYQGYKGRSAAVDAGQARMVDAIHEVTPYQLPSGATVKLPSFYDHVFTDGQGRYLLGDDANYDPNTDAAVNGASWQRIQPTR